MLGTFWVQRRAQRPNPDVAADFLTRHRCVIRENLRVERATRDGHIGHTAIEQVVRSPLSILRTSPFSGCGLFGCDMLLGQFRCARPGFALL